MTNKSNHLDTIWYCSFNLLDKVNSTVLRKKRNDSQISQEHLFTITDR